MDKILLIDGSSLIFRAFYAIRHLSTKDGIATNGVYGFLTMCFKALEENKPSHVLVAFDRKGPTFRTKDYEDYKAGRKKTPDELNMQFGILKDILDKMGVARLDMDDYEADDIIGTLAKTAQEEGFEALCLTGDRDYLQLVDDNIKVILTKKGISQTEDYDNDKIFEEYGLAPKDLIEVKGLMGDKSDNIPGVPGIGEKTAVKLIKEYKTIEGVYDNIEEISGKKMKENLIENENTAFMSRSLGEIFLEVPMNLDMDTYKIGEADVEGLREIFENLEFSTFLAKLPGQETEELDLSYEVYDQGRLEEFKKSLGDKDFTFKIFYNKDEYIWSYPVALAIKGQGEKAWIIYFDRMDDELKEYLREVFMSDALKTSFDIKADHYYLLDKDLGIENYRDNMIAEYLIDPSLSTYSVEDQAKTYLGLSLSSLEDLRGKGAKAKGLADLDELELNDYMARFVILTEKISPKLMDIIEERKMIQLYEDIEVPLTEVLADMELMGVEVDKKVLEDLDKGLEKRVEDLKNEIYDLAGEEFNINSPKQLGVVLFENLGLPVIKRTKTGYSTNQEVLDKLRGKHEIIEMIEDYRSLAKLRSTYIQGMVPLIMDDGRIHTRFRQEITATGRISSQEPNLQNIPIRTEDGRSIRKAFVAGEDKVFVDADYSQIELKVLAHLSEDEHMLEAFETGEDIHRKTAAQVFHKSMEDVTPAERSDAKAVNFGIIYGISDYGLSRDLGISREEAGAYIDRYMKAYPGIKTYMDQIIKDGKEKGYVTTIFNRRRYVPELSSSNFNIRKFGERIALNTPIQGSAADIIKIAMVKTYKKLKDQGLKSKLVLQVHDELIIETHEDEVDQVKTLLKETMEKAVDLKSDIRVDLSTGRSWYES